MFQYRFNVLLKKELKKWTRRFEHTEIFFKKNDKFRKFNSKRIKKKFI